MDLKIKEKIKLSLREVPKFSKSLLKKISQGPLNTDILFNLRLCLEEALVNAVKHGHACSPDKTVTISLSVNERRIEIIIEDEGQGFDYKNIPIPTDKGNLKKPSGRGIFLIKKFMDEVEFFHGGRAIKMVKLLK
jgi:serine/threonine-protein kinase RsbW